MMSRRSSYNRARSLFIAASNCPAIYSRNLQNLYHRFSTERGREHVIARAPSTHLRISRVLCYATEKSAIASRDRRPFVDPRLTIPITDLARTHVQYSATPRSGTACLLVLMSTRKRGAAAASARDIWATRVVDREEGGLVAVQPIGNFALDLLSKHAKYHRRLCPAGLPRH